MIARPQRLVLAIILALVGLAAVPSLAAAITITVDDNRTECPLADYISLPAAVAAAGNGDTIHICAGTYNVPGGPAPSSGLKIEKNLHIEGAGASKVIVQPTPESGSMAQAVPNPRDEYGNVITVRRRLIELYEVTISGLTVRTGTGTGMVPAEAGIAMVDVDVGKISGVKVEGIVPSTGPGTGAYAPAEPLGAAGQGIIVANTIEATDNVTTITGSEVKGFNSTGILVDNRLLGGSASVGNESHVTAKIVNTKITGAGGTPPVAQTGVEGWGSGSRVQITSSKISGVGKADGSAAAIALHGVDLAHSVVGGSDAEGVNLTGNAYGATNVAYDGTAAAAPLVSTHDFWGTTVSSGEAPLVGPDVETAPTLTTAPTEPTLAPVVDTPPTIQWDDSPVSGAEVTAGQSLHLAVVAADDYGVKQVFFKLSGSTIGVAPTPALNGERLYQVTWTPSKTFSGRNLLLSVGATDSSGQVTEKSITISVNGPPRLGAGSGAISGATAGFALVGKPLTCAATDTSFPTATLSYQWTSGGTPVGTAAGYTPTVADQGARLVCTVTAVNAYGQASQAGGPVEVAFLPEFTAAAQVSGTAGVFSGNLATVGEELVCEAAATGETTPTVTYQWLSDGSAVAAATADEYTVVAADAAHTITCLVTATNSGGTVTSSAAVEVAGAPSGGTATISGDGLVGSILTCTSGPWSAVPAASLTYAWLRDGAVIDGASGATYTVTAADAGTSISCRVTATNDLGSADATSGSVAVPAAAVEPAPKSEAPEEKSTPPSITPLHGTLELKGGKAKVATISCAVGPCKVTAPKTVKVKIGGKRYLATVIAPTELAAGASKPVTVKLGSAGLKALAKAGKAEAVLTITVQGGGTSTTTKVTAKLT